MKIATLEQPRVELSAGRLPVTASEAAEASTAQARINIPLNLQNWKSLPLEQASELQWFHQHILDAGLSYARVEIAIGYDSSTIFRVLKGTYDGSWSNVIRAIRKYKAEVASLQKLAAARGSIQRVIFFENKISRRIDSILDYTLARARSSLVLGEGGVGKTEILKHWALNNNHGRSVVVECLPVGGAKGLLRQVADKVGVNKNLNMNQMLESVVRAFNDTRILILNEIQHHVPTSTRVNPIALEMARRIKDLSGCALAMFGTTRCDVNMKAQPYLYEQIVRRAGKPYFLPSEFDEADILPMIAQFIRRPSEDFMGVMLAWSNDRDLGRLNYLVDTLTFAAKCAHDNKRPLTEEMVLAGHQLRENRSRKG